MQRCGLKTRLAAAAAMGVLIAGCDDRGRQIDAPQPAPLAELEAASELPYAEPSQVSYYEPERGYQWAERAYGLQRTFYDAPPDYGFYYDDVEPYVWETADDWALYAEPWGGDYRYYYYEPGAAFPYFVRDREYGYAYGPTGILIAVFDAGGRYLPVDVVHRVAPTAGRYYARGHDLRRASKEARRIVIDDRAWAAEGPRVSRSASPWLRAARDDKAWRQWRERDGDRELARFQAETRRRQDVAEAWRERVARQETQVRPPDRRQEAEALRVQRRQVREDRRDVQAAQRQARIEQHAQQAQVRDRNVSARREAQAKGQQIRMAQQAQAEAHRAQQAERRREAEQAQQVEQRRAMVEQRQQAQRNAERKAMAQQQRQQFQAERQAQREQPHPRAPAATDRGQPAAAHERSARPNVAKDDGRPDHANRGHGKKD